MWHPLQAIPIGWARGLTFILLFVGTLIVGARTNIELKPKRMLSLELAGTKDRAEKIILAWKANGTFEKAFTLQKWDDYFLLLYSLTFALGCVVVADVYGDPAHKLGLWLAWLALGAGFLDVVENRAINRMLAGHIENYWPQLSFICAACKFAILLACFLYIGGGVVARFSLLKSSASTG